MDERSLGQKNTDLREQQRSRIIKLIERETNSNTHKQELRNKLIEFLTNYPFYASDGTPLIHNMPLRFFLKLHGKETCFPCQLTTSVITPSQHETLLIAPSNRNTPTVSSLSAAGNSPIQSERTDSSTSKKSLSVHKCGKTALACAFTCP